MWVCVCVRVCVHVVLFSVRSQSHVVIIAFVLLINHSWGLFRKFNVNSGGPSNSKEIQKCVLTLTCPRPIGTKNSLTLFT